jgi:hypothetical protein
MSIYSKVLAAGALALAVALPAAAEVRVGIYASSPGAYYPPVVHAPRGYVAAPVYYAPDYRYRGRHGWEARREAQWRREQWLRREEWRREQWRREQWRRDHHRHHDGRGHGRH